MPELHLIAAGSLLEFALRDEVVSMPVGRIEYLFLGPMNFQEFLLASGQDKLVDFLQNYELGKKITITIHAQLLELLKKFLLIGGLPEAVGTYAQTKSFFAVEEIHQSILNTYRDDFAKYRDKIPYQRPLLYDHNKLFSRPEIYYWNREKKNSAAEVDYLMANGSNIIPIEVKAGKTGRLKSLHLFLDEKASKLALRFNSEIPSVLDLPEKKKLISLPHYLVEECRRLVASER